MSATVVLFLQILAAAPQALGSISALYQEVKSTLSASDKSTLDPIFDALNAKTDADVAQLDKDAAAHGG